MKILGLGGWHHDANVALLENGHVLALGEEERFTRVRYQGESHLKSIDFCLSEGKCSLKDMDVFTYYMRGDTVEEFQRKYKNSGSTFEHHIEKLIGIDHHGSHAACAFYTSPFENAAIITLDGYGDGYTGSIWFGKGNTITPILRIPNPHSLGALWMGITQYLGFGMRDEGKTMALASYGEPRYVDFLMDRIALKEDGSFEFKFTHDSIKAFIDSRYSFFWDIASCPRLREDPLRQIHFDIAASVQHVTNKIGLHMAHIAFSLTKSPNLCIAGGVALNSVMNGVLVNESPFSNIHVPPFPADNGAGLGSALFYYHQILEKPRTPVTHTLAYFGEEFDNTFIEHNLKHLGGTEITKLPAITSIKKSKYSSRIKYYRPDDIIDVTAEMLANNLVVGWFQGRSEVGPRALGNRSILANPCSIEMRDQVNNNIKHREWFRPLAPSVCEDACKTFFENDHPSPYMTFVYKIRPEVSKFIPAVTHIDGSARVQTVREEQNSKYYALIKTFGEKTGVPVLLNTSFNDREPIVNSPADALSCFLRTEIDALVIGDFIVIKV